MKNHKIIAGILLIGFIWGMVGVATAHPTEIVNYEGSSHTYCHGTNNVASTGALHVSTSTSGRVILLTVSIQQWTEAITAPRAGTVSIGIPYRIGDNDKFGLGMAQNNVNNDNAYWGVGIWELLLDENGTTPHDLKFRVLAPEEEGSYNLIVVALNAANSTGDEVGILRLEKTITVTVAGGSVSTILALIPSLNMSLFLVYAILGALAILIITIYKKKR
jgi:hypothetical protein